MKKIKYLMSLALILVLGVLIYFFYVNSGSKSNSSDTSPEISLVTKVLSKNIEENYPNTAREVVGYFINIQQCYYNEEHTDNELVQLAYQAMALFDDELISNNPFDDYYDMLTAEIDAFKKDGKTISKYILDKASEVIYSEIEGIQYAQLNCIYYLKTESSTKKVVETYILRQNQDGNWKILGWDYYQPSEYLE